MEALKPFPPKRDFSSLSVKDLLEARDAYHVHLAHLANVIATAIGRYRIRCGDWSEKHPPNVKQPEGFKPPNCRALWRTPGSSPGPGPASSSS